MENNHNLTTELVKRILGDLGVVDSNLDNKFGIFQYPIKKRLTIQEFGEERVYPLYSALINLDGNDIKFLSVKIENKDISEKIVIIKESDLVFLIISSDDGAQILLHTDNKIIPISIYMQLQVASLIEFITQHGIMLQQNNDYENLYEKLVDFVEHGVDSDE